MKTEKRQLKIGIIGGGQLAMFLSISCKKFNLKTVVLESSKECSSYGECDELIIGDQSSLDNLEKLFHKVDYVIFENENIDIENLKLIEEKYPNKLIQKRFIMQISQNRLNEKIFLNSVGVPTAPYLSIGNFCDIDLAFKLFQSDLIIKAIRFGYDGKNQILVSKENFCKKKEEIEIFLKSNQSLIEKKLDYKYEISLIGTYENHKSKMFLPITKNNHVNGILFKSEIIYNASLEKQAKAIFKKIIRKLSGKGILTIEFFVMNNDQLIVNELAPRVHNSGHHSLNNCLYSQFDLVALNLLNQVRKNKIINNFKMYNVLGQNYHHMKNFDQYQNDYFFYDYRKSLANANRKMAHINTRFKLDELLKKEK
ncbi:MAG: ATP-grasp domain-containing protein [Mycoplasmoidaceae bacterium]